MLVVARSGDGYRVTALIGSTTTGVFRPKRHGNVLSDTSKLVWPSGKPTGQRLHVRIAYQPSTGYLVYSDGAVHDIVFKKVSSSTVPPTPRSSPSP